MKKTRIAFYGCEDCEKVLFAKAAEKYEVEIKIIEQMISIENASMTKGYSCISVNHKSQITNEILCELKKYGVKYISTRSVGFNHIDLFSAKRNGIVAENVIYSSDSIADFTVMLILMYLRNMKTSLKNTSNLDFRINEICGKEIRDMTIGIIGTGRIGMNVIRRLEGFGCNIIAFDNYHQPNIKYVPLDELLKKSDIITLHIPLCKDTYHFLSKSKIAKMKSNSLIVNTARGGLIDTKELVEALEYQKIGGAALDVIENEEGIFYNDCRNKKIENDYLLRLQGMDNVLITPHSAYYTNHSLNDIVEKTIKNCLIYERKNLNE